MKKWGYLLLLCLIILIAVQVYGPSIGVEIENRNDQSEGQANDKDDETISLDENQIYEGNLLLVNREHKALKQSIKKDIVTLIEHEDLINGYGILDHRISLSEEIASKLSNMLLDAGKEGVSNFMITSGFRDFEAQEMLYEDRGSSYVLPAGYSEHNLGFALDIGSTQEKMVRSPEGDWIEKNAWKYGFILRYPKNKTDITGIQYEPWHIRYVGFPHSAIMKEKNFVLEEYLEYLKKEKRITVTVDKKEYVVSYHIVAENKTVHVPEDNQYEISGDNMDGVIITQYEPERTIELTSTIINMLE